MSPYRISAGPRMPGPSRLLCCACVALLVVCLAAPNLMAQPAEKPTNLKVLDSTISHDQLIEIMQRFSAAMGRGCDYCHAPRGGADSHDLDFASDKKETKKVARQMLRMISNINGTYISKLPGPDSTRVTVQCVTCHRGQPVPILLQDLLKRTRQQHGMAALDSVYRDLRKQYYGSATYDFSDQSMVDLAFDVSQENDSDAVKILNLNKEFNPPSAMTEWALGKIYLDLKDTTAAIAQFKRALEINPSYRRATRDLDVLGAGKTQ